jgi:hypothetical protein
MNFVVEDKALTVKNKSIYAAFLYKPQGTQ